MKIRARSGREGGIMLVECVAYIGISALVLGIAIVAFFQFWDDNKALRRNAEDIVRALHTGDQWRADLRAATGAVQLTDGAGGEKLRVPVTSGEIIYTFSNGELRRQVGAASEQVWLANVKSSRMQSEARGEVKAWTWELELKTVKKNAQCRPLFSFATVAGGAAAR